MPQQCLLAIMSLPTSLLYCAVTLILGYIILEVGFFYYYHWHLLPDANNQITYEPSAPYRDYQQIEDRSKLLIRILDRIDKRMLTTNHSRKKLYYDFIESWFQTKNEDVPFKEFSEQFDIKLGSRPLMQEFDTNTHPGFNIYILSYKLSYPPPPDKENHSVFCFLLFLNFSKSVASIHLFLPCHRE